MSGRFPPPASSDARYSRERSPPRGPERRSTSNYGDSGPPFRSSEPYSARRESPREPPRGPKALIDGPRGGYSGRGRGYGSRADGWDRDFRDPRDDAPFARRGRGQDWGTRERFDGRDRRISPPPRDRSRSPREYRDTRDGPSPAGSSVSDFPSRGRGSYRGRGRGDRDSAQRGRSINMEERELHRTRSRSREWDRQSREERETTAPRKEDERDREDWGRRDPPPYRPESRNSNPASRTPLGSRSTSNASVHQANFDRFAGQTFREARDAAVDQDRKMPGPDGAGVSGLSSKESDRADTAVKRTDSERNPSPPPQAPPVPAFGSIPQRAPATSQETANRTVISRDEAQSQYSLRRNASDPMKEAPSGPKSDLLSGAPTAPKAQQTHGDISEAPRGPGMSSERFGRAATMTTSGAGPKIPNFEQSRNWSKTLPQTPSDST